MISYEVMDEETAMNERFSLLNEGEYDAVVVKSEDKISASSGNAMMDLTLSVYDKDGKAHTVRDFLVFTKSMMWKVIHFADSAGLTKQYSTQRLCSREVKENKVRVKIGIEEGKAIPADKLNGKPLGSKYPSKNKVEDYIKSSEHHFANHAADVKSDDEDVPF